MLDGATIARRRPWAAYKSFGRKSKRLGYHGLSSKHSLPKSKVEVGERICSAHVSGTADLDFICLVFKPHLFLWRMLVLESVGSARMSVTCIRGLRYVPLPQWRTSRSWWSRLEIIRAGSRGTRCLVFLQEAHCARTMCPHDASSTFLFAVSLSKTRRRNRVVKYHACGVWRDKRSRVRVSIHKSCHAALWRIRNCHLPLTVLTVTQSTVGMDM